MQRLKAANPNLKVLIYKDLSGHGRARPVGRRLDRRRDPGRRRAPRVVPAQHERPALHLPLLQLDLGRRHRQRRPTSRSGPTTCSPRWATRAGTASSWTTPTRAWSTTTTSPASPSTRPTRPTRPRPARRWPAIGARFRAAGKLAVPNFGFWKDYPAVINGWLQHVDGGMNENFVKVGTSTAPTATTARRSGRPSCSRSRTPRRRASSTWASRTRPTTTARPPATATRRCCWPVRATRASRCTATTPTRTGSRSTTTRSARPPAPRRATPAACTGARSPTASCS